ncbi:MAG: CoA-binding protein [Armatimonadota bacterium]
MNEAIDTMLAARSFAVAGASTNPEKFGYKCYRELKRSGKTAYPINPRATVIDGDTCYPSVAALPEVPEVVVAVIPPALTEKLVDELRIGGIKNLWIQPGAESAAAVAKAEAAGIRVVHGGPCIMVGLRNHAHANKA